MLMVCSNASGSLMSGSVLTLDVADGATSVCVAVSDAAGFCVIVFSAVRFALTVEQSCVLPRGGLDRVRLVIMNVPSASWKQLILAGSLLRYVVRGGSLREVSFTTGINSDVGCVVAVGLFNTRIKPSYRSSAPRR